MNEHTDIERVLERWFDDGPTRMPDRVVTVVAERIDRQRQRRAWRLPWRPRTMNTPIKLGAAALAVVLVAIVGFNLLPASRPQIGGPSPQSTSSPSPSPTPPDLPAGHLDAGDYVARALPDDPMDFTISVPDGWSGFGGWSISGPASYAGPNGVGIAFLHDPKVTVDPCDRAATQPSPAPTTPTVDDMVAALSARTDLVVSGITDAALAGHPGKRLDLQLPAEPTCQQYYVFAEPQGFYAQGPANHWRVWVVDVDGETAVVVLSDFAATPAADHAAAQAIVDSVRIDR